MWSNNAGVATENDETTIIERCSPERGDHLGLILVAAADQRNSATEIQFFSLRGHVLECAMSGAFE